MTLCFAVHAHSVISLFRLEYFMTTKSAGRRDLLDRVIRAYRPKTLLASLYYNHLIESVRTNSSLLSPRSFRPRSRKQDYRSTEACVRAISRMAKFSDSMIRSPYSWHPQGEPIHSLSKHLFARYDVPEFAHRAWFGEMEEVRIFVDMARGVSPRKAVANSGLNSRLSRTQARSLGANVSLSDRIVKACESYEFEEVFWIELLRFLIYACHVTPNERERSIVVPDDQELGEIAKFVWEQKYVGASQVLGYRVHNDVPLQPNFTFRGRTLRAFRRHMCNWRNEVDIPISTPIEFAMRNRIWNPSGLASFEFVQEGIVWKLVELLESVQLRVEGGKMQHCVAIYDGACRSGRSSIWSLRRCVGLIERPVVTIEVWPESRRIVQMSARKNHSPTPHSVAIIRRWAKANDLKMD